MDMMTRRRAMMGAAAGELPEWDFVWEYTDGLPEDNGFIVTKTGTSTVTLESGSVRLTAKGGTDSHVTIDYPHDFPKGVLEADITTGNTTNWYSYFSLSNGVSNIAVRPQYTSSYKKIYLPNADARADMLELMGCNSGTSYKIRVVLNGGYGDVYINDVLRASSVDISTIKKQNTLTGLVFYAGSTGTYYMYLRSIKMKFNRI